MARLNLQKERILLAFREVIKTSECGPPLSQEDLSSLETCLKKDLSAEAIKRWGIERNLSDSDLRFLLTSFISCFRHFMSDEALDDE